MPIIQVRSLSARCTKHWRKWDFPKEMYWSLPWVSATFFGMMPDSMKESRLYGVELDSITGRIAKQLYPQADVQIKGFEKTDYPNDFFDVAIGNVPFGQYKVADKQYDKNNFLIHDYFFAKTLDKVRPGGVVAFITSKGTMDKASPEVRRYLAQRCRLHGGFLGGGGWGWVKGFFWGGDI